MDRGLDQNVAGGIVDEFEVGFWQIYCGICALGTVVLDRIGMVRTFSDLKSRIQGSAEHCGRDLAYTSTEFRDCLVFLDDQLFLISRGCINRTQDRSKGKFFIWFEDDAIEP